MQLLFVVYKGLITSGMGISYVAVVYAGSSVTKMVVGKNNVACLSQGVLKMPETTCMFPKAMDYLHNSLWQI